MNRTRIIGLAVAILGCVLSLASAAAPASSADLIRARELFFGIENVDATTGEVVSTPADAPERQFRVLSGGMPVV